MKIEMLCGPQDGHDRILWLICKCRAAYQVLHLLSWVGRSYHIPANIAKMWCSPSNALNQTVDTMRNYLEHENFSSFYWESSASSYRVTGDIWRQPSRWYLPWEKSKRSFRGWHASQGKQSSIWCALLDDVFGTLHTWQVPIGVFWKSVLSVVILCKGINKVCLSGFYMCFS